MKEGLEHAYNITRRLRLRLSALAKLPGGHLQQVNRAATLTLEATLALDICGCVLHKFGDNKRSEILAFHRIEEIDEAKLKLAATQLASEVAEAGKVIALTNLPARHAHDRWLRGAGLVNYLGVPLFGFNKELIGVASLFGGVNREFNEEDEWWLRTASQLVADELAYRQAEEKLKELERTLMSKAETSSHGIANERGEKLKLSVLVVEDDRGVNDLICEYLSIENYRVEAAFDGLEAMRRFSPAEHDLVITDVAMPLMNGWELIAALRVRAPELPVLLMTGYGSGNWNESYLKKQGVQAVLHKPVDFARLAKILEEVKAKPLTRLALQS